MTAPEDKEPEEQPRPSPEEHSRETAGRLRETVARLASQLRPFPGFLGMSTLQAIELELPPGSGIQLPPELGCVVVLPDGEISELDLRFIPGPSGPADVDQVEQFIELDLPPEQYIAFATVAVRLLQEETRRRGDTG